MIYLAFKGSEEVKPISMTILKLMIRSFVFRIFMFIMILSFALEPYSSWQKISDSSYEDLYSHIEGNLRVSFSIYASEFSSLDKFTITFLQDEDIEYACERIESYIQMEIIKLKCTEEAETMDGDLVDVYSFYQFQPVNRKDLRYFVTNAWSKTNFWKSNLDNYSEEIKVEIDEQIDLVLNRLLDLDDRHIPLINKVTVSLKDFWEHPPLNFVLREKKGDKEIVFLFTSMKCPTCVTMTRFVYQDEDVLDKIKDKFTPVYIDTEDFSNLKYVNSYNITGTPTHIFLNSEVEEYGRFVGYDSRSDFNDMLDTHIKE